MSTIADRIRWTFQTHGLTQAAFADLADMAPSQFSVLLKRLDERPYAIELETVLRLARAGRVAPRWLLLGEGDPFGKGQGNEDEPRFPRLRNHPNLPRIVGTLQAQGFVLTPELLEWIEEVSLPLQRADELTPEIVVALARMRLQMQYKRTLEPMDYGALAYGPAATPRAPPKRSRAPSAAPKTANKKALGTAPGGQGKRRSG